MATGYGGFLGSSGSLYDDVGLSLTTSAAASSGSYYLQRQQSQHYIDSMRYMMQRIGGSYKTHWDDNNIKKIQDSDYYGREGEAKTMLQRLRRETKNFIGDRGLS